MGPSHLLKVKGYSGDYSLKAPEAEDSDAETDESTDESDQSYVLSEDDISDSEDESGTVMSETLFNQLDLLKKVF